MAQKLDGDVFWSQDLGCRGKNTSRTQNKEVYATLCLQVAKLKHELQQRRVQAGDAEDGQHRRRLELKASQGTASYPLVTAPPSYHTH